MVHRMYEGSDSVKRKVVSMPRLCSHRGWHAKSASSIHCHCWPQHAARQHDTTLQLVDTKWTDATKTDTAWPKAERLKSGGLLPLWNCEWHWYNFFGNYILFGIAAMLTQIVVDASKRPPIMGSNLLGKQRCSLEAATTMDYYCWLNSICAKLYIVAIFFDVFTDSLIFYEQTFLFQ